jgi:hypothetical protein
MAIDVNKVNAMSDKQIINWADRKDEEYAQALIDSYYGYNTGVTCIGPPGIGKSFEGVMILKNEGCLNVNILNSEYDKDDDDNWQLTQLDITQGPLVRKSDYSNWALYADVWANRSKDKGGWLDKPGIVISDDNDQIMKDIVGLSIMMATTERDLIKSVDLTKANFNNELRKRNIPAKFESDAKLVILTNFKMMEEVQKWRNKVYGQNKKEPAFIKRWEALGDRMEYVDMELDHPRLLRVYIEHKLEKYQILQNNARLKSLFGRGLTDKELGLVIDWIRNNQLNLKLHLSLRLAEDIAINIIRYPKDWKNKCMKYVNTF